MKRQYELTISMDYVPEWTYVEAMRELYQNAIDNEIVNPENKMMLTRDKDTVKICNKTSKLEAASLLIGSSTKSDDKRTIGTHGEGYKLAIVVLLREGKNVTIYNYGKKEIWTTKMVKSRRYGGENIPVVTVEREAIWKSVPDNDLTIEVNNISDEDYEQIKLKNLHLRDKKPESIEAEGLGRVLTDEEESGNVYVKGLFVCKNVNLKYGYDFEPEIIRLDRDRRLIDSFNLSWETSKLWVKLINSDDSLISTGISLIKDKCIDTSYLRSHSYNFNDYGDKLGEELLRMFTEEHGEKSIPVTSNVEYQDASKAGYYPIIVPEEHMKYYELASSLSARRNKVKAEIGEKPTSEKLKEVLENNLYNIDTDSVKCVECIIEEIKNMETELRELKEEKAIGLSD